MGVAVDTGSFELHEDDIRG